MNQHPIHPSIILSMLPRFLPESIQKAMMNKDLTALSFEGLGKLMATGLANEKNRLDARDGALQLQKSQEIQ